MIRKRHLVLILQLAVVVGIFVVIFRHIDFKETVTKLHSAIGAYMLLALVLLIGQIVTAALRWIQLLKMAGFVPPITQFIGSFTMGSFVNSAVPGGIGGDAMRVWATVRAGAKLKLALHIILLDRVVSLFGLGLLIVVLTAIRLTLGSEPMLPIHFLALTIGIGSIGGMVALIFIDPILKRLPLKLPRFMTTVRELSQTAGKLVHHPMQALGLTGLVLLSHVMMVASVWALALGLHVFLSPLQALLSVPSALLLSSIPITPGGWGVREGAMVLVLQQFHIPAETALSISILLGVFSIIAHLPIICFCALQRNTRKILFAHQPAVPDIL